MLPPVLVRVSRVGPVHSQRDGGVQLLGRGRSIPRSWLRCRAGTLDLAEQSPGLGPHLHPARSGQAGFSDLASELAERAEEGWADWEKRCSKSQTNGSVPG